MNYIYQNKKPESSSESSNKFLNFFFTSFFSSFFYSFFSSFFTIGFYLNISSSDESFLIIDYFAINFFTIGFYLNISSSDESFLIIDFFINFGLDLNKSSSSELSSNKLDFFNCVFLSILLGASLFFIYLEVSFI